MSAGRPSSDQEPGNWAMRIAGVPFHANTPDNARCLQAALSMILDYYAPARPGTRDELDSLGGRPGESSWPMAAALHCLSIGFSVCWIDAFDLARFGREGYPYLSEFYGHEVAETQARHSDLAREMRHAAQLAVAIEQEIRVPSRADLEACIGRGQPVICNVNAAALGGAPGYLGHFVVVTGLDGHGVRLHDPGLPPVRDRHVRWERFDRAWSYPDERSRNLLHIWLAADRPAPSAARVAPEHPDG